MQTPSEQARKKVKQRAWIRPAVIACCFTLFFVTVSLLRAKYFNPDPRIANEHKAKGKKGMSVSVGDFQGSDNIIPDKWKVWYGDAPLLKEKDLHDAFWDETESTLDLKPDSLGKFKGICWMRAHIKMPYSMTGIPLFLTMDHFGASSIYLDGDLIGEYGTVSKDPKEEKTMLPKTPVFICIADTQSHVLAVRYSNHRFLHNINRYEELMAGFRMVISDIPESHYSSTINNEKVVAWFLILFMMFFTLGLLHLLLFVFYPKLRENLYYSLFVLNFSALVLSPYLLYRTDDPETFLIIKNSFFLIIHVFMISVNACLYSLFTPLHWKRMITVHGACMFISLFIFYLDIAVDLSFLLTFALFIYTSVEAIRTVIYSVRRKKEGSYIIGTGVFVFLFFIAVILFEAVVFGNISLNWSDGTSVYLFGLSILCIASIPLSMSIYVAYIFSKTNRRLEAKLQEVEILSERNLQQEKEKQQILSEQNETLEKQVKERTLELFEQKKLIEEKNKDIIASITYAQRIQRSLMPVERTLEKILANLKNRKR